MSTSVILGIDIGTTSVKVCVIDEDTREELSSESKDTQSNIPPAQSCHPGAHEQNVRKIVSTLHNCVLRLPKEYLRHVKHIGICGQMHGIVLWRSPAWTDKFDLVTEHISNLVTWQDTRCDHALLARLPRPDSHLKAYTGYGINTLLWLLENERGVVSQYTHAATIQDFIVAMLCDLQEPVMSNQNAASWGYFNCKLNSWNETILRSHQPDFPLHLLPKIQPSGTTVGKLTRDWLGINKDTPINVALGDLQCSVLATLQYHTDAIVNISTSAQIAFIDESFIPHDHYVDERGKSIQHPPGKRVLDREASQETAVDERGKSIKHPPGKRVLDREPSQETAVDERGKSIPHSPGRRIPETEANQTTAKRTSRGVGTELEKETEEGTNSEKGTNSENETNKNRRRTEGTKTIRDPDEDSESIGRTNTEGTRGECSRYTVRHYNKLSEELNESEKLQDSIERLARVVEAINVPNRRLGNSNVEAPTQGDSRQDAIRCDEQLGNELNERRAHVRDRNGLSQEALNLEETDDEEIIGYDEVDPIGTNEHNKQLNDLIRSQLTEESTSSRVDLQESTSSQITPDSSEGSRLTRDSSEGSRLTRFESDPMSRVSISSSPNHIEHFPYFHGKYIAVGASMNGGNCLATFVCTLQAWFKEFGFNVPQNQIWSKLINAADPQGHIARNESDLEILPTLLGDRHVTRESAAILNVTPGNLGVAKMFVALCKGIVDNLHSIMDRNLLHASRIDRIIGIGSCLTRNHILQHYIERVYGLRLSIDERASRDASYGAAISTINGAGRS